MASSKTSRRGKRNTTRKVKKDLAPASKPTVSYTSVKERQALIQMCTQIGALIIGQQHDRMNPAIELLNRQAAGLLLKQHLDVWLPRYNEHIAKLESVIGKGLEVDQENLVNDLRSKIERAGYKTMRDFVVQLLLPVLTYNGLLLFLNNDAKVVLPDDVRQEFAAKASRLKYIVGGACAAMTLQEAMGG
ncbi:MAG: hypothetical protein K8I27_08935 [Planctomycetes bacterium]|nr:hypothetical protein [Planctomycetota bacterium]